MLPNIKRLLLAVTITAYMAPATWADGTDEDKSPGSIAAETNSKPTEDASAKAGPSQEAAQPKHAQLLKDAKTIPGMLTLYQKDAKLYAELSSGDYNSEFIVLIAIARGIGRQPLLGGMTWGFGDDWVWVFRKVDDKVHIVRKNVRFKAAKGSPAATAVQYAYTDSVLFSLPIATKGPKGGDLVELTSVFMSDLPQISQVLPGFVFSSAKSSWSSIKGFPDNTEIEVSATYASSGQVQFDSVPDSRGVTINVHYSISKIPTTGYQSRLADDRVGYFITVVKDYSKDSDRDRFKRYINRWHLQKAEPSEKLSAPKEPVVFWIEKTVPFRYRKPIHDGIAEWNKAFEKAGFVNAIEVRQQPADATWDPEDINYNTFRWITSSAGFAMGPSRVNPYTGQILDADIIFDADFLQFWKTQFETMTPASVAAMTGGALDLEAYREELARRLPGSLGDNACLLNQGMARQFAFGATAIGAFAAPQEKAELEERLIVQGLKEVTMHEVGHTLGLRHNFRASALLDLKDVNNTEKTRKQGLVASVMDYTPTNIAPKGTKQGDFFSTTIGPYDIWAIEYGYKPLSGGTEGEEAELKKISSRSGEPELAYATDEDARGIDPDPLVNRFDLGNDPVDYAKRQAKLVSHLMPGLIDRLTKEGDDYSQARRGFNVLLATHGQAMYFAARYVGGMHTSRSHKGDKGGKPPIVVVDPKKQREALTLLEKEVFSDTPYQVPPETYSYLALSRWVHWGTDPLLRSDFPVHEVVLMWQVRTLQQLLSSLTLERINDTELRVPGDKDVLTNAELLETLTGAIFSEVDNIKDGKYTNRKPAISSLRRNLQRAYLKQIAAISLGQRQRAEDCQAIAFSQLSSLKDRINKLLEGDIKLDSYTQAHLADSASRIRRVLDSQVTVSRP